MDKLKESISFGRIPELKKRDDAHLIALKPGRSWNSDYRVKRYASRAQLEAFLTKPGEWYALVKTPTEPNMVIHPAFQRAISQG